MSLFVTFEGADGCGKTTISKLMEEELKKTHEVIRTREPGGTRIGELLRELLLDNNSTDISDRTEALIYAASRAQHVSELIKPALKDGKIVLCERFVLSSVAYQAIGRGQSIKDIEMINEYATAGLRPDIIFLFKSGELSHRRKFKFGADRLENSGDEFHKKVFDFYEGLEALDNLFIIDAKKSIEEVFDECMEVMRRYL